MRVVNRQFLHCFSGEYEGANSHAAVPCAIVLDSGIVRVFESSRDKQNRSHASYIDVILSENLWRVINISDSPILGPGDLGSFDDSGVMPTWVMNKGDQIWMYYIGWNLGKTVTFRNSLGLAVSSDGGNSFQRMFKGPILDRSKEEPHFVASASVIKVGERYQLVYLSCTGWKRSNDGKPLFRYHLKQTESADGINWERPGRIAIDYADEKEIAISRPSILKHEGMYHMWFSARGAEYKVGYASSLDCKTWIRDDGKSGIRANKKSDSWDSSAVCYANVLNYRGRFFMFYNGNRYGETGVGVGELFF